MEIKRTGFFLLMDAIIICSTFFISSNFIHISNAYFYEILAFILLVKLTFFASRRLYKITWRYVSINDFYNLFITATAASLSLVVLFSLLSTKLTQFEYPVSFFLIDWVVSLFFMSSVRIAKRLYLEVLKKKHKGEGVRTIILGAGHTGEMILRDMMRHNYAHFYPVGFLDDDPSKIGAFLHGVKVLSSLQDFERVVADEQIEAVLIAMPTLHFPQLKKIYGSIKRNPNIKIVKTVPRIYDYDIPDFRLKDLEDISIEDLIGRQSVNVDRFLIRNFLEGKRVLITGAGGSIGSEISLQVCSANLEKAIFFDVDETELHSLQLKFKQKFPHLFDRFHFVVGDVRDVKRLEEVFQTFSPQVVFHAAAYKHVPMMEDNAREAVKVNVFGTYNLATTAARYEVDKFILISTDKAVRPTSVMGATKRLAEQVCKAVGSQKNTKTKFIAVRFGNVLGSRGSVLPLFMEQIRAGGPVTVTHHEMKR
ncbi:MAG: polysaccharide biosynthesis protein, partial [Deltaproteobacteria bacterium CG_4_10_14_0_2_um_filter_43_8]